MPLDTTVTLVQSLFPMQPVAQLVRAARAVGMVSDLRAVPPVCSICVVMQRSSRAPFVPNGGYITYFVGHARITVCDHHARRALTARIVGVMS